MQPKRFFIVFEGNDGSGKSTQARALSRRLVKTGLPVLLTHEPGGTALGNRIRRWLKWGGDLSPTTELLLFAAARAELVSSVILPALQKGTVVICDRYTDSTIAYQGFGRGLNIDTIKTLNGVATNGLSPDLVVLLDLDVEKSLERRGKTRDRFEREQMEFHQRVRRGYLELAAADPLNWLVVDGTLPPAAIKKTIWEKVERYLSQA